MKKIYYLASCSTCTRILKELDARAKGFDLQDIKSDPLTPEQLDELKSLAGSYDALFSRRAMLYKERGLKDQNLGEPDFRKLILEEYTFLRRPVIVTGKDIYIGNEYTRLLGGH